jgi:hypothetical protein
MKIIIIFIATWALETVAAAGGYFPPSDQSRQPDALTICQSTEKYRVFKAQQDVVDTLSQIEALKQERLQQHRITIESGVRNLRAEYEIGAQIVTANDDLKIYWRQYKERGGKASSPQKIPTNLVDPCENVIVQ